MAAVEATADEAIERAADMLSRATRVVVLSGAGMSAESGIHTFRDPEAGVWKNKLLLALFGTPFGWNWMPGIAWTQYRRFRDPIAAAQPNAGHAAVAQMAAALRVDVQIATQNVDALHQRAGSDAATVYELHGSVMRYRCTKRGHPAAVPSGGGDGDAAAFPQAVPHCAECGSPIRPDAVLFGESLPADAWDRATAAVRQLSRGDVLFVVGTSGVVYPAASLPEYARQGVCTIEVNPERTQLSQSMGLHVPCGAAVAMPRILARAVQLKQQQQQQAASEAPSAI